MAREGVHMKKKKKLMLNSSAYCGLPASFEAFRVADRVLNEMEARGEIKRER
jgi:4-carboxymuconolactone decarboxylase